MIVQVSASGRQLGSGIKYRFLSGRRERTRAHLTRSTGTIATAVTTVIVIAVTVVVAIAIVVFG